MSGTWNRSGRKSGGNRHKRFDLPRLDVVLLAQEAKIRVGLNPMRFPSVYQVASILQLETDGWLRICAGCTIPTHHRPTTWKRARQTQAVGAGACHSLARRSGESKRTSVAVAHDAGVNALTVRGT